MLPMSRRSLISAVAAFAACPASARSMSLEEVIARNAKARGGAARLNSLRSIQSVVRVTEPGFTVLGRYLATADGLVRVDIYADTKRVFSEGVDAAGVWSWSGDKPEPVAGTEKGKAALLHGIEFNLIGLNRMVSRGHELRLGPIEPDGQQGIDLKLADGFETRLFLDPRTWQIVRRQDHRAFHVDVDQTKKRIESRYSDFRVVDGVTTSFRTEEVDLGTGKQVGSSDLLSLNWNVDSTGRIDRAALPMAAPVTG